GLYRAVCCGSSAFLKRFYGAGYILKLSLFNDTIPVNMLPLIQTHVPDASIKAVHTTNRKSKSIEMRITLPTETVNTSVLCEMFTALTQQKEELGIKSVGLSLTTMDEVFLRVGELAEGRNIQPPPATTTTAAAAPSLASGLTETEIASQTTNNVTPNHVVEQKPTGNTINEIKRERNTGCKLEMEQFAALLVKKFIYTYRKWKLILIQLSIPIFLLSWTVWSTRNVFDVPNPKPPLEMTMSSYINPVTIASCSDTNICDQFSKVIGPSLKTLPENTNVIDSLLDVANSDLADYREKYIVGFEANRTNLNAMFSTIPNHAAPLALNLAANIFLKSLTSENLEIRVTNHPWRNKILSFAYGADPDITYTEEAIRIPLLFGIFMPIGLALLVSSFTVLPTEEKLCKAKQLQMMTGVGQLTYWITTFIWDYFYFFLVVCAMMACFPVFQRHNLFTAYGGVGVAFTILLLFGFSSIWLSYIASLFSRTAAGGFALVAIVHILSGVAISFLVYVFENNEEDGALIQLQNGGGLDVCFPVSGHQYNCDQLPEVNCSMPLAYFTWIHKRDSLLPIFKDANDTEDNSTDSGLLPDVPQIELPGIKQELLFMIIQAPIYFAILMLLEYEVFGWLFGMLCQRKYETSADSDGLLPTDEDVLVEKHRVAEMVKTEQVHEDALVRFESQFCPSWEVLTFGNNHIRMITGDETHSLGNAHAFNTTLEKDPNAPVVWSAQRCSCNAVGWKLTSGLRNLTSGVDPVSRRQFHDVLRGVRDTGQSIILTSHSMEECEALCSRLGIMVNGKLTCLGGVQHLKHKFAQGYTLSVKLKHSLSQKLRTESG
ncbi:ATP-binding cassette sub-family A member 3, partial [Orchesella cincta]